MQGYAAFGYTGIPFVSSSVTVPAGARLSSEIVTPRFLWQLTETVTVQHGRPRGSLLVWRDAVGTRRLTSARRKRVHHAIQRGSANLPWCGILYESSHVGVSR